MKDLSFEIVLPHMLQRDPRYPPDAYRFVREVLDIAMAIKQRDPNRTTHHVNGRELLDGFRTIALREFGPLARRVLDHWGLQTTEDVGNVVFNMVEEGLLGRSEDDRREDFLDVFDFVEAFDRPFLPSYETTGAGVIEATPCETERKRDSAPSDGA